MNKKNIAALVISLITCSHVIANDSLITLETQQRISPEAINSNFTYLDQSLDRNNIDFDNSFSNNKIQNNTSSIGDVIQNNFNNDISLTVSECEIPVSSNDRDYVITALTPIPTSINSNFSYNCNSLIATDTYLIGSKKDKVHTSNEIGALIFHNASFKAKYEYSSDIERLNSITLNVELPDETSKASIALKIPESVLDLVSNPKSQEELDAHMGLVDHIDGTLSNFYITDIQESTL